MRAHTKVTKERRGSLEVSGLAGLGSDPRQDQLGELADSAPTCRHTMYLPLGHKRFKNNVQLAHRCVSLPLMGVSGAASVPLAASLLAVYLSHCVVKHEF